MDRQSRRQSMQASKKMGSSRRFGRGPLGRFRHSISVANAAEASAVSEKQGVHRRAGRTKSVLLKKQYSSRRIIREPEEPLEGEEPLESEQQQQQADDKKDWLADFMSRGYSPKPTAVASMNTNQQQGNKSKMELDFSVIEYSKNRPDSAEFTLQDKDNSDDKKKDDSLGDLLHQTDNLFREFNPDLLESIGSIGESNDNNGEARHNQDSNLTSRRHQFHHHSRRHHRHDGHRGRSSSRHHGASARLNYL
mmetsp:Transcript_11862/g.32905  ORF Transcript_11862/g.32905 Transcript_11862/m.32905 type:complete len:250 (-) Transcript_11862:77-826(-)